MIVAAVLAIVAVVVVVIAAPAFFLNLAFVVGETGLFLGISAAQLSRLVRFERSTRMNLVVYWFGAFGIRGCIIQAELPRPA